MKETYENVTLTIDRETITNRFFDVECTFKPYEATAHIYVKSIEQLKEQIEKMKCCDNCSWSFKWEEEIGDVCHKCQVNGKRNNWGLMEDDN